MGRPRKSVSEKLTASLRVDLTEADAARVALNAAAANLSVSAYVRRTLLNGSVIIEKAKTRPLDEATFQELRRIGVNLNQIARAANATGEIPRRLDFVCEQLEALLLHQISGSAPGGSVRR